MFRSDFSNRGQQPGANHGEQGSLAGIVVRDAVLPAAEGDADPLESQRPDGGVVVFAAAFLLAIIDAGPLAEADRMADPFVECLAEKVRTSAPEVDPFALAAPLHNWCDATELLHVARRGIASRSERPKAANRRGAKAGPAPGNESKIGKSGVPWRPADLLFQFVDALAEGSDRLHQDLGHPHRGLDHGRIADRRNGLGDLLQRSPRQSIPDCGSSAGQRRTQGRRPGFLQVFQRGPAQQEHTHQRRIHFSNQSSICEK